MTNKTISALSSASTIVGTEVLPIVQSSATVKVSVANLTSGLGTIIATKGGTGQTSYAVGDLLYADTTTTLAKLPDVATGNALISGGVSTAPSWGKIDLTTHVTGVLPVANGGTNASTASITSFNNITGYTASGTTGTTSTNLVFSTSPSITTPTLVGNATLSTGNLAIGTSGKGITTSSAIPLGLGTNGSTNQATLFSSGGVSIGNTTDPGGASRLSVTGTIQTTSGTFLNAAASVTCTALNTYYTVQQYYWGLYVFRDGTSGGTAMVLYDSTGATIVSSTITGLGVQVASYSTLQVRVTSGSAPRTLYWACVSAVSS